MRRALAGLLLLALMPLGVTAASDLVLCDGQTHTGWTKAVYKLDGGVYADASVRKVIRNCTFRDSARGSGTQPPIILLNVRNVLVTGSTFRNIHTGVAGNGVHGIAIKGNSVADGVTIENSTFTDIAADGVQAGDSGPNVTNLVIRGNTFLAPSSGGENAIDIKGTAGPTLIENNVVADFHPCDGNVSDCSGSQGAGIVVHDSSTGSRPRNVTIRNNNIRDNERGVTFSQTDSGTASGNNFCANVIDIYYGADNGPLVIVNNTACSEPTPTVSADPGASYGPTEAPATPAPTRSPWWCWFTRICR